MLKITVNDEHGEQKRIQCSLDILKDEPADSRILELFERRRDGNILVSPGKVDVSPENPMNFLFVQHPCIRANTWAGKPISEYPHRTHAVNLANEYEEVKRTQEPSLYWLRQSFAGCTRTYLRLLVPQGPFVYYATRYEEFPDRWLV